MDTTPKHTTTSTGGSIEPVFSRTTQDFNPDDKPDLDTPLETMLENEPHMYDLHTHLLGMGNTGFWIDSILNNPKILPKHADFRVKPELRKRLCPLIWTEMKDDEQQNTNCFIDGDRTAMFFHLLIEKNFPGRGNDLNALRESIIVDLYGDNRDNVEIPVFERLMDDEFVRILKHYNLFFGISKQYKTKENITDQNKYGDFTYDVVLTLADLGKAFGVTTSWMVEVDDLIQSKVEEKLGLHSYQNPTRPRPFRLWIVFNAREQRFQVVKGMTVESLRELITVHANAPSQACALARAHLQNAFSMCNPDGTDARLIDFDRFQGSFTPEFYPRRFALKDSIYSQRLDVLASLLVHILRRYQCCLPPVRYCEISIGVGDICRPWVFDVLSSFPAYDPIAREDKNLPATSTFRQMISKKGHFPHLRSACATVRNNPPCVPNVTYKFLAGFNRQAVKADRLKDQPEAIRLLNESPDVAIHYMLEEIAESDKEQLREEQSKPSQENNSAPDQPKRSSMFDKSLAELARLEIATRNIKHFKFWVVGLDLFGDELGYPYCPFVAWPFRRYVRDRRNENRYFGLRIHCGENVLFADNDVSAYRHFIAHMYIAFRSLRFLRRKLGTGIRIGHGIAFARILSDSMDLSTHRKSSVLLAEMREHAKYVLKKIIFEINITSNEYLLGQALRGGCYNQIIRLSALTDKNIPIILSTDDDGVWPIDHCRSKHPGHHSLVAEYCRAFSLSIITSHKQLQTMLSDTNKFCFYSLDGIFIPKEHSEAHWKLPKDDTNGSTIIFHPDLIKMIMFYSYFCRDKDQQKKSFYERYRRFYPNFCEFSNTERSWFERCHIFAQIAFVALTTNEDPNSLTNIEVEFGDIFPNSQDNFQTICTALNNVRTRFMFPNNASNDQHIVTNTNHVFLSESSSEEQQTLRSTLQFSNNHSGRCHIQVFSSRLSELDTSQEFKTTLRSLSQTTNISAAVYTNKTKDEYINPSNFKRTKLTLEAQSTSCRNEDPIDADRVQFTFNEKPSNRINCAEATEEHMLYVICRHSSAATAYLHHIGNELIKENKSSQSNENRHPEQVTDQDQLGAESTENKSQ